MRFGTQGAEGSGRKLGTGHSLLDTRKVRAGSANPNPVLEACVCPKKGRFVREEEGNLI